MSRATMPKSIVWAGRETKGRKIMPNCAEGQSRAVREAMKSTAPLAPSDGVVQVVMSLMSMPPRLDRTPADK
eukprot:754462-Hanusia_phi.AAC.2